MQSAHFLNRRSISSVGRGSSKKLFAVEQTGFDKYLIWLWLAAILVSETTVLLSVTMPGAREGAKLRPEYVMCAIFAVVGVVNLVSSRRWISLLVSAGVVGIVSGAIVVAANVQNANLSYSFLNGLLISTGIFSFFASQDLFSRLSEFRRWLVRLCNGSVAIACLAILDHVLLCMDRSPVDLVLSAPRTIQGAGWATRFVGFTTHPLEAASLYGLLTLLALGLKRYRSAAFFGFIILMTGSAGGILALLAGISVFGVLAVTGRGWIRLVSLVVPVIIGLALIPLGWQWKGQNSWSLEQRLAFYEVFPEVLDSYPLGMGVGMSRYLTSQFSIYTAVGNFQEYMDHGIVESSHLEICYEFGIVGILMELILLFFLGRAIIRCPRNWMLAAFLGICVFYWTHAFLQPAMLISMRIYLILGALLGVFAFLSSSRSRRDLVRDFRSAV